MYDADNTGRARSPPLMRWNFRYEKNLIVHGHGEHFFHSSKEAVQHIAYIFDREVKKYHADATLGALDALSAELNIIITYTLESDSDAD